MSQAKITREEIKEAGTTFSAVLIETNNAYIMLLSEGEVNLGTLAVSLPQKPGMIGPPLSSTLLGERNSMLARMLAERLAKKMERMVLVSVFVKTMDAREAGPILLRLSDKLLKKRGA
ncbi:MAG: proteasome assembly chaperone 4 family protein [Candidatus Bathyarchaeota archaeon]|nr:proteasome assembly chaperone 4 family protein [Candidatus Bathyarchaeota archaeon]